jgi:hypothetical protein
VSGQNVELVLGLPFLDRDFEAVQANNDDAAFAIAGLIAFGLGAQRLEIRKLGRYEPWPHAQDASTHRYPAGPRRCPTGPRRLAGRARCASC